MGAVVTAEGVAFTVYASQAEAVDLCFYLPERPTKEVARARMAAVEAGCWHLHLAGVPEGMLYGYRVHGVWAPEQGLAHNARKLLLDPYARAIVGDCRGRLDMLTMPGPRQPPGSTDNGRTALKSVVLRGDYDWGGDLPPRIPWHETVLYELHVRGFTQLHPEVPPKLRGTYAGLATPPVVNYLKQLGVTAVQLLPVHQHLDDGFLVDKGLTNYWGYNTIGFFAPHTEYASTSDPVAMLREFKDMVKAYHAAGMEVILDVVYNHTAEGDGNGPTLMFRGLDNQAYYRFLEKEKRLYYHNMTGCGNAVASNRPAALRLALDSLRYWVTEMHVDGFRFDLAVTVGRGETGYDRGSAFFTAVGQDPVLAQVKMIAEPWDVGEMDSYQLGNFPAPWRELNGRFRDTARRFWRGDSHGTAASFAKRLCGSEDIFGWDRRPPTASLNFITSHDGFTLRDLVSYHQKQNLANGEENRDGDHDNHSTNGGVEGETQDKEINAARLCRARALIASMICAQGVPFITAGDERWRTQKGNNNAYCQDNGISWVDWEESAMAKQMREFVQELLAFRRAHEVLRRTKYYSGLLDRDSELRDVSWLDGNGGLLDHEEWHETERRRFGMLLAGPPVLLFLFSGADLPQAFPLPGGDNAEWELVFDTSREQPFERGVVVENPYPQQGPSVVCLRLVAGSCLPMIAL
jgi:isoamylase